MTEPVSTTTQIAGGSSIIALYTALFGVEYGQDIAIIIAGVFGAFFALASSARMSEGISMAMPVSRIPVSPGIFSTMARFLHIHTSQHRTAWITLIQGGTFAGTTANLVAKYISTYFPEKLQVTVPDLLLVVALIIGALSDRVIPTLRKFLGKKADKLSE